MKKKVVIHQFNLVAVSHSNDRPNKVQLTLKQTSVSPACSLFTKTYKIEIDMPDNEYQLTFKERQVDWTKWNWPGYLENGQLVLLTKIVPVDMSDYDVIGKFNLVKDKPVPKDAIKPAMAC